MTSLAEKLDQYGGAGTADRVLGSSSSTTSSSSSDGGVNWDAIKAMEDAGYVANPDGTITQPDGTIYNPNKATKQDKASRKAGTASLKSLLREYGLEDLSQFVDRWVRDGLSWQEIELQLYDPSTKAGKVVDKIYPELRLRSEAGLPPTNIAQIQEYRATTRQLVNSLGFGDAIGDTNALARDYLVGHKSLKEMEARLTDIGDYAMAVLEGNPASKAKLDELEAYYGVRPSRSDLIAFALNDDFTEATLQKRLAAAAVGAAAKTSTFGDITREQAETLGSLGVSEDQARQGFGTLAGLKGATGDLAGQNVDVIDQQSQLDAAFGGNEFARRRIAKRQREQQGLFSAGGGFASTRSGFGGVGTAQ